MHVGKIVTLKGVQSRTYLPHVVGVRVDGEYALSDKIVFVTGRLSSYETTEEDVKAYNKARSPYSWGPRRSVGTHFTMTDPITGDDPKSYLWDDRGK